MIFDIASVVFVLLCAFIMKKRGGISTILSLSGLVLSIAVATGLYPVLTDAVYKTPLPENLEAIVMENISSNGELDAWEAVDALPDFIRNAVNIQVNEAAQNVLEVVSESVTRVIINVMIFLLLVVLTKIIVTCIISGLNLVMKLPVLKTLNSAVGFAGGFIIGVVIVWLAVAFSGSIAASNSTVGQWLEGSRVVEVMSNITFS